MQADDAGTTINFTRNSDDAQLLVADLECGVNEMLCNSVFTTDVEQLDYQEILDFVLTANPSATRINVTVPYEAEVDGPPHPISGHYIMDEGVGLPEQPYLNFVGAGVVADDNGPGNSTTVTVLDLTCAAGQAVTSDGTTCTCTSTLTATDLTCTDCLGLTEIQDLYLQNGLAGDTMMGTLDMRNGSTTSPELAFTPIGGGTQWHILANQADGLRVFTYGDAGTIDIEAEDTDPPFQQVDVTLDGDADIGGTVTAGRASAW